MKLLALILAAVAGYLTYDEIKRGDELLIQMTRYCNMVQLYQETDGQNGWPDYNGNAKEVCK